MQGIYIHVWYLETQDQGHLFVTQTGFGAKGGGQHVASFGLASSGVSMRNPAGIVIDEDEFVYVCDHSSTSDKFVVF